MSTKLIVLLIIGALVLITLACMLIRAGRYRRNHPEENIFLLLPFFLLLFAGGTANAQGGHGLPNNPYRIRKAKELVAFANCLSTGNEFYFYKYGYSKEYICSTTPPSSGEYDTIPAYGEGKYFLIPNDITLNQGNLAACDGEIDPAWTVWPETVVFKGHLLGDMHTISGMYIDCPDGTVGVGFFSKMEGDAHIEKLGVVNSYIRGGASNIGGMVGELSGGHINDCFFEGSIRTNGSNVGGFIGLMTAYDDTTAGTQSSPMLPEISVCFASGHVDCTGDYVAGLVGKVEKGTVRQSYSSMIVRTTEMVGTALSGANPTHGGIGTDEEIVNNHIGGIYGYALSPSGSNSYNPATDSIRVDTCYFDWQLSDLPSIPGSSWVPADWRDKRGAAALSTYDMTYYSQMYFDIKNQKPSLWKNTYLCNVYPYPDPFNDPINVTYRLELDYPQDSIVTATLVPFLDVFMKPNGNGQSTINNMNDQERKHMKLSDLTESFVLWKGCDSLDITWTLDSLWPDAVRREFYAPDNSWNVYLQKQGVVRLTVEVAGRTRYYDAVVNIPPYVGSAENPFLISNLEDFLAFRDGINANEDFVYHRFLIPHDSLPHIHWIQTADIDLASVGDWVSIGKNADTCFTGFYDGRGHKLMNLTMTNGTDRALFVYSKGEISNLVLEDPHITGCRGSSAALATNVKGGSFENCAVTYSAESNNHSPLQFVGSQCAALIGSVEMGNESHTSIHITGCFNSCDIVNYLNGGYAAGLVGYVNADTCILERCFNTGDISVVSGVVHPLVGRSRSTTRRIYTNCYNAGVLTGNQVEVESAYTTFYNDYHVNPVCEGATKVATRYFIGPEALVREYMGDDDWLYEEGRYPRLTWTDSSSIRPNAIAACTPRLALDSLPLPDTMTVDNFHDLNNLRNIVNGNYMVIYKDYLLPHYVQDIVFSLTNDINLTDITSNWISIGTKRFAGTFLGNNHTLTRLSSTRPVVGLFGTLTGKVYDLNITVETIVGADTAGAVCAILNGGRIENCSVKKYNNTSDNLYGITVGGIAGVSLTANDSIIGCFNYVDVMGIQCIGGIIAKDGNVKNSANLGDITGNADCPYIGGISGCNTNVISSLNTGIVTAQPGNALVDNYVGGLVGAIHNSQFIIHNCYNAGIVNGENRKYVGGICGAIDGSITNNPSPIIQNCYVSNTVRSTGTHLGSIVGSIINYQLSIINCCYDKQMSPAGGIDGSDQTEVAEGLPTDTMMGEPYMKPLLGGDSSDSIWYYQDDYYPQLKGVQSINAILSKASAMRAKLYTTETYSTVSHQFTLNYADGGNWQRVGGSNCVSLGSPSNNLITATIPSTNNHPAQGFITLGFKGAGTNDPVYRKVQLWVNLTEENPIIIKDADELKKFRTIINQGSGYYRYTDQTFFTSTPNNTSTCVRITDGGRNLYFKLTADVDLAFHGTTSSGQQYNVLDLWTSIGTQNRPFLGHFDGGNHTVANFIIPGSDNQGFFGYIYGGSVKNLTIAGAITNHKSTGNNSGILCGYLNSGTIRNCFITQVVGSNYHSPSRISAITGRNLGFICGTNHYGRIVRCQTDMTQIENATYTHGSCFGGICGYNDFGTIDSCRSHLSINPGVTIDTVGGIVGYNHNGILVADTSYNNSYNKSIMSYVGCIVGYSNGTQSEIRSCYVDEQSRVPSHGNYIGGVVGKMDNGIIDGCEHLGTIIAEGNYIGGIAGLCTKGARINGCFNAGTICETKIDDYVGGIVGSLTDSSSVSACFNSGLVMGRYFVGGLIGHLSEACHFTDCYHTGIVKGISLVGGIVGLQQDPTVSSGYGYSAGWVEGSSMVGAVCGYTSDMTKFHDLNYDKQMCSYKGVNEEDVTGVTAHSTSEMMGVTFGSDRPWMYGEGMYPRLSTISDTDASKVSALALQIGDIYNLSYNPNTSYTLPSYTPVTGTNFKWSKVKNSDNTASLSGTTLTPSGMRNFMQIKATKSIFSNGENHIIPLRAVQLSFGISEQQPLTLNSLGFPQLRTFIKEGQTFYYSNGSFYASNQLLTDATPIPADADGFYFRLNTDVNYIDHSWLPIGTEEHPFRGYLDGGGHTVHVSFINTSEDFDFWGLFGYLQGRVKNLFLYDIFLSADNHVGALAGYCNGTVSHCSTLSSCSSTPVVQGQTAVGGLIGKAFFSQIFNCYNGSNVRGNQSVGGIVGLIDNGELITENYLGSIKQSFNYGMVSGSDNDSRVGGLVGSMENGKWIIENCYNTGAVSGKTNAAGFAGAIQNAQFTIHDCYNAGYVTANSQVSPFGNSILNSEFLILNSYFDKQLCPLPAVNDTTALLTTEMIGDGLETKLGDTYWSYNENEYPRLKTIHNSSFIIHNSIAAIASVKPIYLTGRMLVNSIVADFKGDTTAGVKWYRYGTGTALNEPDPENANGNFTLNTCGEDSLMVVLTDSNVCARRVVPLNVAAANIKVDTILACSAYTWKPTNDHTEILEEPGFYSYSPEGEDCDSTKAIELFFSTPLETTIDKQDACMDSYWSKYGHNIGFLKATVIGGGFSTEHTVTEYTYEWSRANGTIDNESFIVGHPDSLRYLSSDTYYLTTTDINAPLCQAHDTILVDEYSFNYLATKWGNCVDTDDGWIELVIRQFEFNRDGSPYSIMCWDSNHRLIADDTIPALNPPDESGVPKGYDTLFNLANGLYYITITDSLGCYQDKQIKVNDPINPKMTLRANGFKKVYDGTPVSLNDINRINVVEYDDNWKVPERAEYYITSDKWRQLALRIGDSLIVSLSNPNMMIKDVDSVRNKIVGWSIKDAETGKDKTCLYHFYPIDSCIVIVPATLTLFTGSATKEYDGTELTNYNWNVQGLQNGEHVWCMPSASLTDVDTIENSCYIDWGNPGPWGENIAQQKNYTVINHFGTLSVTPNTQPVTITAGSSTKTYDGTPLINGTISYSGLPNGFYVEATTSGSQTDVGTIENEVTSYVIKNANGEDKTAYFTNVTTVAGTLTVEPADLFITTPSATKPYDGSALTAAFDPSTGAGSISGLAANESISVTTTGSQTEVGESTNTYTIDWGTTNPDNYEISDDLGVLKVNSNSSQITLTATSDSKPYDGTPLTNSSVDVDINGSLPTGFTVEATASGSQTNVGTSDNVVTYYAVKNADGEDKTAYFSNITTVNGVLTVTANTTAVTLTAASDTKTYDGMPLTNSTVTVTDLPAGFTVEVTASGSQTDAGTGANVVNDDYIIRNAAGEDKTSDFTGVLKVAGTLTVNPKPATITAHNASKTYGEADPTFTATVTGAVNGETIEYTLSRNPGDTVGTYEITVTPNSNPNYQFSILNSQFSIQARPITVSVENRTVYYNGSEQFGNTIYTFSNLLAGHTATITYTPPRGTLVGTYSDGSFNPASLSITNGSDDVTDNYNLTAASAGTLTIEPATDPSVLTVVAHSSTNNVYDGSEKSVAGFETLEFFVGGNKFTVSGLTTSDPSSTNVCSLLNEITGHPVVTDAQGNDVTSQFRVDTVYGRLIIAPRPITVKADNRSKTYGDTDPILTATVSGAVVGDAIAYSLSRVPGDTVGTYPITVTPGDNPNYTLNVQGGTFAITKKPATVIADNKSKTYGENDPALTATVTGTVGSDAIAYSLNRETGETVSTYPITVTLGSNPNYQVTATEGIFTITRASLTVKADDKEKTFGANDPELTATVSGLQNGDAANVVSYTLSRTAGENVGSYTIMPAGNAVQGNYNVTYQPGTLTISSSDEVVVRIAGHRDTTVYNGVEHAVSGYDVISISNSLYTEADFTFSGTASAARTDVGTTLMGLNANQFSNTNANFAHVSFIVTEDGCQMITKAPATVVANNANKTYGDSDPTLTATVSGSVVGDTLAYSLSRAPGDTVGTYSITVTLGSNPNYEVTATGATFTINKKAATITANDSSKTYGEADPTLTATVSGTVVGDTIAYSLSREAGETAGTYPITVTLGNNPNYDVIATGATFTINKKAATVAADTLGKIYGDTDPTLTATVSGTEGSDVIAYSLSRATGENAGTYPVTVTLGNNPNYQVTTTNGLFKINKRIATVTANNNSKTYGDADPDFTATVEDVVEGDTLDVTVARTEGEIVGMYPITVSVVNNPNYEVIRNNGVFSINPADLTIKADNKTKVYGAADPTLTASVSGLRNGDAASSINYSLSRAAGENVADYAITVTPGNNPNYTVNTTNGVFSITKKSATVVANNKSKVYGNADPDLTATVTGSVEGDAIAYSLSRAEGEDVGTYPIAVTLGSNPNYEVTTTPGILTITPATAMVMADNKEKVQGAADPLLTATITGLKNGDSENVIAYTISRESGDTVGTYAITPSGAAKQGNYNVTYLPGVLTIVGDTLIVNGALDNLTVNGCTAADAPAPYTTVDELIVAGLTFQGDCQTGTVLHVSNLDVSTGSCSTVTRIYTITDDCGNSVTANQIINIIHNQAPHEIDEPVPTSSEVHCYLTETDPPHENPIVTMPTVVDSCGNVLNFSSYSSSNDYHSSTCTGDFTYNYTYQDCAGKVFQWNYTYHVLPPTLTFNDNDLTDVTLENTCYSEDVTSHLKTDGDVWNMYSTSCDNLYNLSVTSKDTVESASNCSWKVTRIFTATYGCTTDIRTQSVSGGKAAPTFTAPDDIALCRNIDGSYTITPTVTGTVQNVSGICSTVDTTYSDAEPVENQDGSLTIVRTWTVTDTCQNSIQKQQVITVKPLPTIIIEPISQEITYGNYITPVVTSAPVILTTLPEGLSYSLTSQTITGKPTAAGNYTITATTTNTMQCTAEKVITINVNKKPATVVANNNSKTYGDTDPELTASVSGTVGSDAIAYSLSRTEGDTVGSYPITVTLGNNPNYEVTATNGTFTITPAALTVKADNKEKMHGAPDPELTATIAGLRNGDSESLISYTISREAGEDVGTYAITPAGADKQGNYDVTYLPGVLTIVNNTLIISGTLDALTVNGCTADDVPEPYTTVAELEAAGLTIQGDCQTETGFHVSSDEVIIGSTCVTVTRSYTISDDCGNSVTTSQIIYITHNEAPHEIDGPVPTSSEVHCYLTETDPPHVNPNVTMPTVVDSCGNVLDFGTPTVSNNYHTSTCSGDFTYYYTYTDCAGKVFQWNYTYHVLPPTLIFDESGLTDVTLGNTCYSEDVTSHLKTNGDVWNMYSGNCDQLFNLTVTSEDTVISASNCAWEIKRTFTATYGCTTDVRTQSVSGGNTTAPTFTAPDDIAIFRNVDGSYTITPDVTGTAQNVVGTCSTVDTSYSDATPVENQDGSLTIVRTWTVTDTCQNATSKEQVITVNPLPTTTVTITGRTDTKTYNGNEQSVIGYTISIPEGVTLTDADITGPTVAQAVGTNVTTENDGKYMMGLTSEQFSATTSDYSVSFVVIDGWLKISPRNVTLTSATDSKEYDGTPLTNSAVAEGGDGFVAGEGATYDVTGRQLVVGNSDNTFSYTLNTNTSAANYNITPRYGTLTVTDRTEPYTITMTSKSNTTPITYDGQEHTISGFVTNTFTTTDGNEYTVSGLTASVTGTFAGSYDNTITGTAVVKDEFDNDVTNQFDISLATGTLTIGRRAITFTIAPQYATKTYDGDIMIVDAAHLTVSGLAPNDEVTNGRIMTESYLVGEYTCAEGGFEADFVGVAYKEGFEITHPSGVASTSSYMPRFNVTLRIEQALPPCLGVEYHGHFYDAVRVGTQCWFTENLRWATGNHHAYREDIANVEKFGYLYSWYTAMGIEENDDEAMPETFIGDDGEPYVQGICPTGWAVGSETDFALLNTTAGGTDALKDMNTLYWLGGYEGNTPNTSFNARANGRFNSETRRYEDGMTGSYFWMPESAITGTLHNSAVIQYYCNEGMFRNHPRADLQGVRCIRKVAQ